jgi:hypothetical protein
MWWLFNNTSLLDSTDCNLTHIKWIKMSKICASFIIRFCYESLDCNVTDYITCYKIWNKFKNMLSDELFICLVMLMHSNWQYLSILNEFCYFMGTDSCWRLSLFFKWCVCGSLVHNLVGVEIMMNGRDIFVK